jgi:phage terminase small subunit
VNARRQRFVAEYLKDLNATQAALRAGYAKKAAYQQGVRLLRNAQVAAAVEAGKAKRMQRIEIDQDKVIAGLLREADREGKGSQHGARVNAWGLLGRHLGMFVDRHEIDAVSGGLRVEIVPAQKVGK